MCCVVSVLISVTQDSFYTRISSGLNRGAKESFPCLTISQFVSESISQLGSLSVFLI